MKLLSLAIGVAFAAGISSCRYAALGVRPELNHQASVLAGLRFPIEIAGQPPHRMDLRDRMREYHVPAVSIAVIHGNRIEWTAAIGRKRGDSPDSISSETIMQAASISKPLVATAIMRLVDRGTLSVSDSANLWLKSWKIPSNAFTMQTPVRVEHLLSHTAGATNGAVGIYTPGTAVPTLLQALDGTPPSNRPPVRIDTRPGTEWRYAGGGYSILQQMLIDITRSPFPELMSNLVLSPVGMHSSCFCQPLPDSLAPRAAAGHDADGKPIAGGWWTLPEMAAGGLWTTAGDLAHFMIAINRAWAGGSDALLRKATARSMLTPVMGGWGLGFAVDTVGTELRYSHTGSNNGYRSVFVGYPERGDGIVILTNGDGGASLRDEIIRSAAVEYGWPGYAVDVRATNATANASLDDFAGRFQYAPRFVSTFTVSGDSLVGALNNSPPIRLYPQAKDVFFTLVGSTYRFIRGAGGAVESVSVLGVGSSELRGRRLGP